MNIYLNFRRMVNNMVCGRPIPYVESQGKGACAQGQYEYKTAKTNHTNAMFNIKMQAGQSNFAKKEMNCPKTFIANLQRQKKRPETSQALRKRQA